MHESDPTTDPNQTRPVKARMVRIARMPWGSATGASYPGSVLLAGGLLLSLLIGAGGA